MFWLVLRNLILMQKTPNNNVILKKGNTAGQHPKLELRPVDIKQQQRYVQTPSIDNNANIFNARNNSDHSRQISSLNGGMNSPRDYRTKFEAAHMNPIYNHGTGQSRQQGRKIHTSHGVGGRIKYTNKRNIVGNDLFGQFQTASLMTSVGEPFNSSQMGQESTQSTVVTRAQQVARDLLHQKMPGTQSGARRAHTRPHDAVPQNDFRSFSLVPGKAAQMRRASAFEAPARGSRLQQAKGQLVTAARNKRRSIGTHGGGSALGSFSDANAAQRGHGLSTQYERAGLPGYAESLKGDVTTAIDIVEKSEGFLYGGWTRSERVNSPLDDGVGLGAIIPELNASLGPSGNQTSLGSRAGRLRVATNYGDSDPVNKLKGFMSKGKATALTSGGDDYSESFQRTFNADRNQAKEFMMNRLSRNKGYKQGPNSPALSNIDTKRGTTAPQIQNRPFESRIGRQFKSQDSTGVDKDMLEVSPDEFNTELARQNNRQKVAVDKKHMVNKKRALKRQGLGSQEVSDSNSSKDSLDARIDRKAVNKAHDRLMIDRQNSQLQVHELSDKFMKERKQEAMKANKAQVNQLKTKPTIREVKRPEKMPYKQQKDFQHGKVEFHEDQKQMIKRLFLESRGLGKQDIKDKFMDRLTTFFEKDIYDQNQEMMIQAGATPRVDPDAEVESEESADSFASGELYSEHDYAEDNENEHGKPINPELKKRRDFFMKGIEKRLVKGQGMHGFYQLKNESGAHNENDRVRILTQMFLTQMKNDMQEETENLMQEQEEILKAPDVLERLEDLDEANMASQGSIKSKGSPTRSVKPGQKMSLNKIESMVDHKIEDIVATGFTALEKIAEGNQRQTVLDDKIDLTVEVNDFGVETIAGNQFDLMQQLSDVAAFQGDDDEGDNFFEEYKNERSGNATPLHNLSDSSDETDVEHLLYEAGFHNKKNAASGINIKNITQVEDTKDQNAHIMKKETFILNKLQQIVEKAKFSEIMQRLNSGQQTGLSQTPAYIFQQECHNTLDLMLPIVNKMQDQSLILQDYQIHPGQARGIAQAIMVTGKPHLKNVLFENCGMSDQMVADLLAAFAHQKRLEQFSYKRSVFMENALERLGEVLQMPPPHNLIELRLVNCKTSKRVMQQLCYSLGQYECNLRSLSLVQMKMNFPLDDIAQLVEKSTYLQDIDFSANDFQPLHFAPLLKTLAYNKVLHSVNLSWNKLMEEKAHNAPLDLEELRRPINELNDNGINYKFIHLENMTENMFVRDMPALLVEAIGRFIRYNKNVMCVNLQNTGLNSNVLASFLPALRHSKSLLCFHLGQNPGINKQVKAFWRERLSIAPKETQLVIDVKRDRDDLKRPLTKGERARLNQNEIKIRDYKVANFRRWLLEEAAAIQSKRNFAKLFNKNEINMLSANNKDLCVSRMLGHKEIMPGSGQWKLSSKVDHTSCWNCGNWVFTLIFWNQQIGVLNANNNINIESNEKKRIIDLVRQNDENYMGNDTVPMLFSNATNWVGKPFMKLMDFMKITSGHKNFTEQATAMAKEKLEFGDLDTLKFEDRERADEFIENKCAFLHKKHELDLIKKFENGDFAKTRHEYTRYGKPLLINREKVTDPMNTFVLPIFIKPGRTHFIMRTPADLRVKAKVASGKRVRIMSYQNRKDVHFRFYYNRHIVPVRQEKVPGFAKNMKLHTGNIDFMKNKHQSIFRDWKADTQQTVEKCLENDFNEWKVLRLVKDTKDLNALKAFISANFAQLKELRIGAIAHTSNPPQLNVKGFKQMCELTTLKDNHRKQLRSQQDIVE